MLVTPSLTENESNLSLVTSEIPGVLSLAATLESRGSISDEECLRERYWSFFLASSLITFFSGLICILSWKLAQHFISVSTRPAKPTITRRDSRGLADPRCWSAFKRGEVAFMTRMKWYAEECISGQTAVGRILVSLSCVLSIGSLIIYLIDASSAGRKEETCIPWIQSVSQQVDLVFNTYFMITFLIRLIAANDKLSFWLEVHSFVDYFTIPPAFVGIYLSRQWLGLRFLRALRLMSFPDILQYLSLLRTSNSIRLAQIVCSFLSIWLAAAGFIHLVETSGDPFYNFENVQNLTYWQCVYFVIVTMSTVGYGDVFCETTIGRLFIVFFILGALAMFASFIPEFIDIVGRRDRYGGAYDKPVGVRHIVVCGHITYESIQNFLRDFLHEDRENQNVKCIFLDSKSPDLEMEALFKRHFTQVVFFKGTVMNTRDLEKVKVLDADAVLIMVNPRCRDPDAEDAANIMRVISVKNYNQDIRVIAQLMRYQNKSFLLNLPSWGNVDQVISIAEMKLGFVAQSCLAQGFSTLMANLFVMRSYKKSNKFAQWQDLYLRGAGMEMYTERFSEAFYGRPFPQAVELCYTKLQLLLIAVTVGTDDGYQVVLNPGSDVIIEQETKGFFICQSEDEVKRAAIYCVSCHSHQMEVSQIRQCICIKTGTKGRMFSMQESVNGAINTDDEEHIKNGRSMDDVKEKSERGKKQKTGGVKNSKGGSQLKKRITSQSMCVSCPEIPKCDPTPEPATITAIPSTTAAEFDTDIEPEPEPRPDVKAEHRRREQFDSTGLFHWCHDRSFREAILSHDRNRDVMKRLRHHIVVCLFADSKSPLTGLCNLVMPMRSSSLRAEELKTIVLVGNEIYLRREWDFLRYFPDIYVKLGSPLNRADLRAVKINQCHQVVILSANDSSADDPTLIDKEAILCSLNIKTMSFQNISDIWKSSPARTLQTLSLLRSRSSGDMLHRPTTGACIPMVTELANDYNVQFLDQDDEDDPEMPLYMTQPYACGRAFAASVLDSLMSTAFFNPDSLNLIRMLLTGGANPQLDQILAEGVGLVEGAMTERMLRARDRCRVAQLSLEDSCLAQFSGMSYGLLLEGALRTYGILCLGMYRQVDPRPSVGSYHRYVITNPPAHFPLYPSDKIYCLVPFKIGEIMSLTGERHVSTRL